MTTAIVLAMVVGALSYLAQAEHRRTAVALWRQAELSRPRVK